MDEAPFASDCFGKLAENLAVLVEVTASHWENVDPQPAEVPQAWPKLFKVNPLVACGVREHRHYVPVTVGAMRLSRPTTEEPYLLGLENLEDAVHNAIGKPGRCHDFQFYWQSPTPTTEARHAPAVRRFWTIDGPH
jgi:hypothetical protein